VPESLVVDKTNENINLQLSTISSTVHGFVAVVVESIVEQLFAKVIDDVVVFIGFECFIFNLLSFKSSRLCGQTFDEHTDCHSTGEGVGVDDDIWGHASLCEWHVNFRPKH